MCGVAFKPNADDVRFAPALYIRRLLAETAAISIYDPRAIDKAKGELSGVTVCEDRYPSSSGAEAIPEPTEWEDFVGVD